MVCLMYMHSRTCILGERAVETKCTTSWRGKREEEGQPPGKSLLHLFSRLPPFLSCILCAPPKSSSSIIAFSLSVPIPSSPPLLQPSSRLSPPLSLSFPLSLSPPSPPCLLSYSPPFLSPTLLPPLSSSFSSPLHSPLLPPVFPPGSIRRSSPAAPGPVSGAGIGARPAGWASSPAPRSS